MPWHVAIEKTSDQSRPGSFVSSRLRMTRHSKLGLGTAQWGMVYGISNPGSRTDNQEVARILEFAEASDILLLDTAPLYGQAEETLGRQKLDNFRVITKTPRFSSKVINPEDALELTRSFNQSLARTKNGALDGLLAHDSDDLLAPGGALLIEAMRVLKDNDKVSRIGVSVYESGQIHALLDHFVPDIIQLPFNVFDQRLMVDGTLERLKALGVEVHARSALLQGLLTMDMDSLPNYFSPWRALLSAWHAAYREQGLTSIQAAIGYVCDLACVDYCIVGVESYTQLEQCVSGLDSAPQFDASTLGCNDPALLNPSNWCLS
jgi:aryl-alcohol dehydrogenase-like predicted oxidoreductase